MLDSKVAMNLERLWETLWKAGIESPLTALEQVTYLLYIKHADHFRRPFRPKEEIPDRLTWANVVNSPDHRRLELVEEAFNYYFRYEPIDPFARAAQRAVSVLSRGRLLDEVVHLINSLPGTSVIPVDVFEALLNWLGRDARTSMCLSPSAISDALVQLTSPRHGEHVFDPTAGTAGTLIRAYRHAKDLKRNSVSMSLGGYERDASVLQLAQFNLMVNGIFDATLIGDDVLATGTSREGLIDVIVCQPPFTGTAERWIQEAFEISTNRVELLFLQQCMAKLAPGGRCAIVVPDSVLFSSSRAHEEVRRRLLGYFNVEAVVGLPNGIFKPSTNLNAAILVIRKDPPQTDWVWFYESHEDSTVPVAGERLSTAPLDRVAEAFALRMEPDLGREQLDLPKEAIWTVPHAVIAERGFGLSPSLYRPSAESSRVYESPQVIVESIVQMEEEIAMGVRDLRRMVEALLHEH